MDERDLEAEHPAARLGVDQLRSRLRQAREGGADVGDLVGDMVHARAPLREEATDGSVLAERREQLDAALPDPDGRRLDALLIDAGAVLDHPAEEPPVRVERLVEVLDSDADVVDSPSFHAGDRM